MNPSECLQDLSEEDLVSYVFSRRGAFEPNLKIYVNAEDEREFITYKQARCAVGEIATRLKENGLEREDCVCIHSYNHIHYPLIWLGVIAAGGVVTGSNPAYTTQELVHHFTITDTKFIVAHKDRLSSIVDAVEESHIASGRIFSFGGGVNSGQNSHQHWSIPFQHRSVSNREVVAQSDRFTQRSDLAAYATTSGTTGLPKAAELTHRYFIAQLSAIEELYHGRDDPIIQLHCLPVFHAFAAPIALLLPLRMGMTTYYLPRFHPQHFVRAISKFQITDTAVVPPIVAILLKLTSSQHELLMSLRYMVCAGAPLATTLQSALSKILHPQFVISQCWGCTEVGWISTFRTDQRDYSGSVGYLLSNTQLKIVGHDGRIVAEDGVPGEALIKSNSMFRGYKMTNSLSENPRACDIEGFYATGDLVSVKCGKIYIQGRVKDIMKVKGWQVSPDEIQSVIMELAPRGVQDCAVVGLTCLDDDGLQITLPRAYVVRSAESTVSAQDIVAKVKNDLVSYKQITGGVVFVSHIPRNSTGKIVRRLLTTATVVEPTSTRPGATIKDCLMALCLIIGSVGFVLVAAIMQAILCEQVRL